MCCEDYVHIYLFCVSLISFAQIDCAVTLVSATICVVLSSDGMFSSTVSVKRTMTKLFVVVFIFFFFVFSLMMLLMIVIFK